MKFFEGKRNLILTYTFFILYALSVFIIHKFLSVTLWSSILTFFLLILWPGFSLFRIFRFQTDDFSGKLVLWISLGFAYTFVMTTLAILFGLTINSLLTVYLICQGLIFLLSLILDLTFKQVKSDESGIKKIFQMKNLIFVPILFFLILIFIMVSITGANLAGDPAFHLTIVRKAFEGQPLIISNLTYIKNTIHIAYGFPIWHVFIALLAKLQKVEIVTMWYLLPPALFWITLVVWYFLFKQILNSRLLAILSLFFFIFFNISRFGYLFTRLTVPDTFSTLLLLPLIIGLTLKFVFGKITNFKLLILILILTLFLIFIHATHYFYLLTIMLVFAMSYGLTIFWHKEYWPTLKRVLLFLTINFLTTAVLFLLLEIKKNFVSDYINMMLQSQQGLLYNTVSYKWVIFILVLSLFIKKNPKISILASSFLIVPLAAVHLWQQWIIRFPNIGLTFMQRLKQNVSWLFIFWGLVLGFIILLLDRCFGKIKSKSIKLIIYLTLLVSIVIIVWSESKSQKIAQFYQGFVNQTGDWIIARLVIFIIILSCFVVALFVVGRFKPKFGEFFQFDEPKNYLFVTLLCLISFLVVFSNWRSQLDIIDKKSLNLKLLAPVGDNTTNITTYNRYGGKETFEFIRNNVPQKSVFLVPESDYIFAILADQYMVGYPKSPALNEYLNIYDPKIELDQRLSLLKKGKIDYVLLTKSNLPSKVLFDNDAGYFTKIYDRGGAIIYMVEK